VVAFGFIARQGCDVIAGVEQGDELAAPW
jgi:hypothetical protein